MKEIWKEMESKYTEKKTEEWMLLRSKLSFLVCKYMDLNGLGKEYLKPVMSKIRSRSSSTSSSSSSSRSTTSSACIVYEHLNRVNQSPASVVYEQPNSLSPSVSIETVPYNPHSIEKEYKPNEPNEPVMEEEILLSCEDAEILFFAEQSDLSQVI